MRRVAGKVIRYPARLARNLAAQWDAFWYSPADPTLMGLRILTGLMLLYTHAVWGLALDDFFGPSSWLSRALVREIQRDQFSYSFWTWVPAGAIGPAHAASMLVLLLFTIGLWTRLTSVLALVVAISYAQRVPAALFGLDQINVMLTLYLAIGHSGQALSIDRWVAWQGEADEAPRSRPSVAANFGQRLIQVHMCVIYFFAGISKLQGPAWWDGEAMWLAFANQEYQSADMTWLAWHPWLLNVVTYTTFLWEMSFCTLVWKPTARPLVLSAAVLLHVGIGVCLGMWTFGLIMLVGCASFLPNEAVRQAVARLMSRPGRAAGAAMSMPAPARRMTAGPDPRSTRPTARGPARPRDGGAGPAPGTARSPFPHARTEPCAPGLVPVFVVLAHTSFDRDPEDWAFVHPGFREEFEPLYIVVTFDHAQAPLADP